MVDEARLAEIRARVNALSPLDADVLVNDEAWLLAEIDRLRAEVAERAEYSAYLVNSEAHEIAQCPTAGCLQLLDYEQPGDVFCGAGHQFRHYRACDGLLPIDPATFKAIGPMYVSEHQVTRLLDLSARVWNALVWYSGDKSKFWWRLVEVMESLRDEAHRRVDDKTQMDYEVDRLRAAISNGTQR